MSLVAGTKLGPYEVVSAIGAGGMGEVYKARDTRLDRDVALKILPESFADDPDRRARFEREAKAVAALNHPNIMTIFDVGEVDGVFFAAMELLEGQTLRDRLTDGSLPLRKAIEFGVQIARGLASAHDRGIVHRDLKPENLFLVGDGQLKILDFGLAHQMNETPGTGATATAALTDPGTVMGTMGYMAPEQVRGQAIDGRADLFSLGAVLYEMVTGQRAFQRDTAADTMSAILREEPPEASGSRAETSPTLDRIIRHCLEKNPTERFQTARDVAFALGSLSGSSTSAVVAAMPEPSRARGRAWMVSAVVALMAIAAGVAIGRGSVPAASFPEFFGRTYAPQVIFNARFLPDGQTLVFSAAEAGNEPSLFESRSESSAPRPFGPPRTHLLSVSPTGELAVLTETHFLNHRLFKGTLARMSMDSAPRVLASDVREADWLPDGSDLVVIREVATGDQLEFPVGNIVHRSAAYLSDPRVSPDGLRVAFMEHPEKFDDRGTVKVVDRAGTVTTISQELWGEEGIAWQSDSRTVVFSGATLADYKLLSVPADGSRPPAPLISAAGTLFIHDIAPDGRMVVTREDMRYGVVARGAGRDAERDLSVLDLTWNVDLSADGRFVVVSDGRAGRDYAVVMRGVDGSPPVQLGPGNVNVGAFSPDGRWVMANQFSTGQCVAYPTGVGTKVSIQMGSLEQCVSSVWFPDGKHVLLMGHEPGKPMRAFRLAFPDGTPEALLPEGIVVRLISPGGQWLLGRSPDGVWQRWDLKGVSTLVNGLEPDDEPVEWGDNEDTVVVTRRAQLPTTLTRVQLTTGARTTIGGFAPANTAGLLWVAPTAYRDGGRQYAYGYLRRLSSLYLVTGVR